MNANPQEVDVIGHTTVNRTTKRKPKGRVCENFTEIAVENWTKPAGLAVLDGQ
ncbi:MAG: hypothetical protein R3C03_16990 [Pirellulaceae bacterium]